LTLVRYPASTEKSKRNGLGSVCAWAVRARNTRIIVSPDLKADRNRRTPWPQGGAESDYNKVGRGAFIDLLERGWGIVKSDNLEIARFLHLKAEIRNLKLDNQVEASTRNVRHTRTREKGA
jgi:hypothetical protein